MSDPPWKPLSTMTPAERGAWIERQPKDSRPFLRKLYWDSVHPSLELFDKLLAEEKQRDLEEERSQQAERHRERRQLIAERRDARTPESPDAALARSLTLRVPPECAREARWFLHLLELSEQAIDAQRPRNDEETASHHRKLTRRFALIRRVKRECGADKWANILVVRDAIKQLARDLALPSPEPPKGWEEPRSAKLVLGTTPIVDVAPDVPLKRRRRVQLGHVGRPPTEKAPAPVAIEKRSAKLKARMARIEKALRSAGPEGLSGNALFKKLGGGRAQLTQALQLMLRDKRLVERPTENGSRYLLRV